MRDERRAVRPVPVVVVLASLLVGGCASRGGPGMDCRSELLPHGVSLAEFADSSNLQGALASAWDERTGLAVAAVRYDSVGALDTVRVWSDAPAVASADRMAAAIRAASPERREPDAEIELFLGHARGPAVRRVRPLGFCAPRMTNLDVVAARLSEETRRGQRPLQLTRSGAGSQIQEASRRCADPEPFAARDLVRGDGRCPVYTYCVTGSTPAALDRDVHRVSLPWHRDEPPDGSGAAMADEAAGPHASVAAISRSLTPPTGPTR